MIFIIKDRKEWKDNNFIENITKIKLFKKVRDKITIQKRNKKKI